MDIDKTNPLFSVIVPIYNVEQYLEQCIDSILSQTYNNFELILVDDGSPDNCPNICDRYADVNNRVRTIHKQNGGQTSARKVGANASKGQYIVCVDADDWVHKDLLLKISEVLKKNDVDSIVYGCYRYQNAKCIRQLTNVKAGYYNKNKIIEEIYPYLIEDKYGNYFSPWVCAKAIKRDLYISEQNKVDERIRIGEDAAVIKPIMSKIQSMFVIHDHLYYYRDNYKSITKSKKPFDIYGAKLIGVHLNANMNDRDLFVSQIYRYVVHNLFTSCITQFYAKNTTNAKQIIQQALDDEYYKEALDNCQYSIKHIKGIVALICLKKRLYSVMRLMSYVYR